MKGLFRERRLAYCVGRFRTEGPRGYRAWTMPGAPLRVTRADAEADELRWLEANAHDNDA